MKLTDNEQANRLIARFREGEELSDEEIDALGDYLGKDTPPVPDLSPDPERGRHLRLALRWHKLLNEVLS